MKTRALVKTITFFSVVCFMILAQGTATVIAHCDAENGPVAVDARKALAEDDFETVAIWVGEKQHEELRAAFDRAIAIYRMGDTAIAAIRGMGGKAKDLAGQYFMETAVRLHREAEGMSYTGLKPARQLPEDIEAAEEALETGDIGPVTDMLSAEMEKKLRHVFENARTARQNRDKSLDAGRKWADAYVKYVIYVHELYNTINAGPAHGVGE